MSQGKAWEIKPIETRTQERREWKRKKMNWEQTGDKEKRRRAEDMCPNPGFRSSRAVTRLQP